MIDWLATLVIAAALVMAGWTVLLAMRDRRFGVATLGALVTVELAALAQLIVAMVLLVVGPRPDDVAAFVGYHVVALLVLPAAVAWGVEDRSRWGTGVLAVGCIALAAMTGRMQQIWATAGG